MLLAAGAPIDQQNMFGSTALIRAARRGNVLGSECERGSNLNYIPANPHNLETSNPFLVSPRPANPKHDTLDYKSIIIR
jgi:ankyrin repeat protein